MFEYAIFVVYFFLIKFYHEGERRLPYAALPMIRSIEIRLHNWRLAYESLRLVQNQELIPEDCIKFDNYIKYFML